MGKYESVQPRSDSPNSHDGEPMAMNLTLEGGLAIGRLSAIQQPFVQGSNWYELLVAAIKNKTTDGIADGTIEKTLRQFGIDKKGPLEQLANRNFLLEFFLRNSDAQKQSLQRLKDRRGS